MDIQLLLIEEEATIIDAMERLDKAAKKVLFVVQGTRLEAAITDGDIRRWILAKGDLNAAVKNAANYNPKYLKTYERNLAEDFMKKNIVEALPIIDEEQNIVSIILRDNDEIPMKKDMLTLPVVMMAGGLGTRLYPYTKILPKPLIPVGEIPIAEHIINRFYSFGCSEYYLIINHKKNMIKAYFNEIEKDYTVNYIDEDIPLGTGGGLSLLKGKIHKTFILTNCDILINEDMYKIYTYHKEQGNLITMICSLKNFNIPYGVVEIGKGGNIEKMQEKPIYSFFTNTGCYIAEPEVIEEIEDNISVSFPEIIEKYKEKGKKVGVFPISENSWLDMGQLDELEKMKHILEKEQ